MRFTLTESKGTKRIYGTVYPADIIGVGFNTRFGGYYLALREDS